MAFFEVQRAINRQKGELLALGTMGVRRRGHWSEFLLEPERDACAAWLTILPIARDLGRDRALRIQFERQTRCNLWRLIIFAVVESIPKSI